MVEPRKRTQLLAGGAGLVVLAIVTIVIFGTPFGVGASGGAASDRLCTRSAGQDCAIPIGSGPSWSSPTLRSLARAYGIRIGTAVNVDAAAEDTGYAQVLNREFSSITAEVAMKWGKVEPTQGVYDWTGADSIVELAQRNGQQVYGHALVWHSSLPSWLPQTGMSGADASALLQRHIDDEVSRYRGKVWAWDVVNEPLDSEGHLRDSVWSRAIGPDYIANALRWARTADPLARLFINDYGIESVNPKSNALYDLVRQLLASGVPIDGIGFQTHLADDQAPADFAANLRRFTDLGIDVAITEADVRITGPVTSKKLTDQAGVYRKVIDACLAVRRCVSYTVWGFSDKYSWVPNAQPDAGAACLFDTDFRPKPAYDAVVAALAQRKGSSPSPTKRAR